MVIGSFDVSSNYRNGAVLADDAMAAVEEEVERLILRISENGRSF